jgi:hypothetical protein
VVQEFWRRYAKPVAMREAEVKGVIQAGYAFEFLRAPRGDAYDAGFSRRLPFLPGAGLLTWAGDKALAEGKAAEAARSYGKWTKEYGRLAILQDRLARVARLEGRPGAAAGHVRAARAAGWVVPGGH